MMKRGQLKISITGALLVLFISADAAASEETESPELRYRVGLFDDLFTNLADTFSDQNLLVHWLAIAGTAMFTATGADDDIQRWFWRDHRLLGASITKPTFAIGWFTPALIPTAIALTGLAIDDDDTASAGVVALQAVAINAVIVQLLKYITGRPLPYKDGRASESGRLGIERSGSAREWEVFGGGVAWPSGHTSAHMALASSLVAFYPDEGWLPFVAYPFVALMGLAMIEGDHHWASDVVAGALIGHTVGWTVGSNARDRVNEARGIAREPRGLTFAPVATGDGFMLMLALDP